MAGESQSRCVWHVFCDATGVIPPIGPFERFEAAAELAQIADRRMKMAIVIRPEIIDYIFENVARNRGVFVAVFGEEVAALKWLLDAKAG